MKTKTLFAGLAAAALLAGTLTACASNASPEETTGGEPTSDLAGKKVAFLTLTPSCNVCVALTDAAVETLEAQGVEVTTQTSEFEAGADQTQQLNQALSTQPDAVIVWPADTTAIVPALQRARETNPDVKLIVTTYAPEGDTDGLYDAFIGVDDRALGAAAATSLVEGITEAGLSSTGGIIVIEGPRGVSTAVVRQEGFEEELAKIAPDLRILASQPANWDQTEATTVSSALFSRFAGDIVGVFAHSDVMANGVVLAADRSSMKLGEDLMLVGIDCSIEGYNNISDGKQYATGLWNPIAIGEMTGEVTLDILGGGTPDLTTYISSPQITQANLSECKGALGE